MKQLLTALLLIGLLFYQYLLFPAFESPKEVIHAVNTSVLSILAIDSEKEAFEILDAKCNVCHRKQNPFKVFSLKNMDKHAPKIYDQVFIKRRMPKGDQIKLTDQEYQTLQQWLTSQNIF